MNTIQLTRIAAGVAIAVGGGFLAAPPSPPVAFPVMILLTAFAAGFLIGKWWSAILVPVGLMVGLFAWQSIECATCAVGESYPIEYQILLGTAFYLAVAAVAALGTLLSRITGSLQRTFG